MADLITQVQNLKTRITGLHRDIDSKRANLAVIKATYKSTLETAYSKFGVSSPEELDQAITRMSGELEQDVVLISKAIEMFEAKNFTAAAQLLSKFNEDIT